MQLAENESLREQLKAAIEVQIVLYDTKSYGSYTQEAYLTILYELIEAYGSREEEEQFIQQHIRFTAFREMQIARHMESKDYSSVIALAEAGEQQDKQLPGLVSRWKKVRYEAYKQLVRTSEQKALAKDLLLDGNYEYYQELEELCDDKELLYKNLLVDLKNSGSWQARSMYLKLIDDKHDFEEMIDYVRNNPSSIAGYAARLVAHYSEEVEQLYRQYIEQMAAAASKRKDYQGVCRALNHYKGICGKNGYFEMINQFKVQYARRPAFLDELDTCK